MVTRQNVGTKNIFNPIFYHDMDMHMIRGAKIENRNFRGTKFEENF
jgi:hypothetical protein